MCGGGNSFVNQLVNDVADGVGEVGGLIGDLDGLINGTVSTVESATDQIANGVFSTVAGAVSDLGNLADSTVNDVVDDIQQGLSSIGTTIAQTAETAVSDFNSIVSSSETSIASELTELGNNAADFLKQYGHTIIDAAADYVCPGSSILIDLLWTEVENGGTLPSLAALGQTAAESLISDELPGIDDALSDVLPDVASDVAAGELNTVVTTYVSTGRLPTGQALLEGAGSSLIDSVDATSVLSGLLPDDLTDDLTLATDAAGAVTSIAASAAGLGSLSQSQILALAGAGILEFDSTDDISFTPSQALALIASDITVSSPDTSILDTSADILTYSAAQLDALKSVGINTLTATDASTILLGNADLSNIVSADLMLDSTAGPVYLAENASGMSNLSDSVIQEAADAGIGGIVGNAAVLLNDDQASSALLYDVKIYTTDATAIDVNLSAEDIAGLSAGEVADLAQYLNDPIVSATGPITISLAETQSFIAENIQIHVPNGDQITVEDPDNFISNLAPEAISDLGTFGISAIQESTTPLVLNAAQALALESAGIAVLSGADTLAGLTDTATDLLALTSSEVAALRSEGFTAWTVLDSAEEVLNLTDGQLAELTDLGVGNIQVDDPISSLSGLNTAELGALQADGVTTWELDDTLPNVLSLISSGTSLPERITSWSVFATPAALEALTSEEIAALMSAGISRITLATTTNDAPVQLTLPVALALQSDNFVLENPSRATIALNLPAEILEALSPGQIVQMGSLGITQVDLEESAAVTLSQAESLRSSNINIIEVYPNNRSEVTVSLGLGNYSSDGSLTFDGVDGTTVRA